jgi:hypothetical protein
MTFARTTIRFVRASSSATRILRAIAHRHKQKAFDPSGGFN